MSAGERGVAKALAQASHHPLSRALLEQLTDTVAAPVREIREVAGQGVEGIWEDTPVRLGRGHWLGAGFDGLGLREVVSGLRHQERELARSGDAMQRLVVRSEATDAETLLHPRGLGDFRVMVATR